jgi:hypothetical protein
LLNPEIWNLFVRFTFDAINAGHRNYSADAVLHRVRWETSVASKGAEFKCNNNWTAFYARKFHKLYPQHKGFFRLRVSKADEMRHD